MAHIQGVLGGRLSRKRRRDVGYSVNTYGGGMFRKDDPIRSRAVRTLEGLSEIIFDKIVDLDKFISWVFDRLCEGFGFGASGSAG